MNTLDLEIVSLLLASRWVRAPLPTLVHALRQIDQRSPNFERPYLVGLKVERLAARVLGVDSCLPQAIAASALYQRHGHPVQLVIGHTLPFQAHAWLELHGTPVVGGGPPHHELWRAHL